MINWNKTHEHLYIAQDPYSLCRRGTVDVGLTHTYILLVFVNVLKSTYFYISRCIRVQSILLEYIYIFFLILGKENSYCMSYNKIKYIINAKLYLYLWIFLAIFAANLKATGNRGWALLRWSLEGSKLSVWKPRFPQLLGPLKLKFQGKL